MRHQITGLDCPIFHLWDQVDDAALLTPASYCNERGPYQHAAEIVTGSKMHIFFLSKKKSTQNKRLTFFTMGSDLWKTQPRQQCEHKTLLCRKRKGQKQNNVVLLLISHLMGATRMKWVPALDSRCEYAAKQYDYYLFIFSSAAI